MRNSGSFTVRVIGVPLSGVDPFTAELFVSLSLAHAHTFPGPTAPFRPFDLAPGQERMLILRGVFARCRDYGGRTMAKYTSFPIRFSFLWRTETVRLPLVDPLVIEVPAGRRCAAR